MISGLPHTGVCVPNLEAAVEWYTKTLGLVLLSPPAQIEGRAIEEDMGEMIPAIVLNVRMVELLLVELPDTVGEGQRLGEVLEAELDAAQMVTVDDSPGRVDLRDEPPDSPLQLQGVRGIRSRGSLDVDETALDRRNHSALPRAQSIGRSVGVELWRGYMSTTVPAGQLDPRTPRCR